MDLALMFLLAGVMFGFAYFALHSMRRKRWTEWKREFSKRDCDASKTEEATTAVQGHELVAAGRRESDEPPA